MEAKKLTDLCYMITDSYNNKLGLAFVREKILFTYDLELYDTIEDIANKFNEKLIYTELPSNEEVIREINDYPIKHDTFCDVEEESFDDSVIYTYKTREGSNIKLVAGWWAITTDSITRATLSPKLTTLNADTIGPFKSRFECQAEVTRLNREKSGV